MFWSGSHGNANKMHFRAFWAWRLYHCPHNHTSKMRSATPSLQMQDPSDTYLKIHSLHCHSAFISPLIHLYDLSWVNLQIATWKGGKGWHRLAPWLMPCLIVPALIQSCRHCGNQLSTWLFFYFYQVVPPCHSVPNHGCTQSQAANQTSFAARACQGYTNRVWFGVKGHWEVNEESRLASEGREVRPEWLTTSGKVVNENVRE